MKKKWWLLIIPALCIIIAIMGFIFFRQMANKIRSSIVLHYEVGQQAGSEVCTDCHLQIYEEWAQNSSHIESTTSPFFLDSVDKITDNFVLNSMFDDVVCFSCHGTKEVSDGVNCETCHGTVIEDASIMETHEKKYTPGLEDMREPSFCGQCHELASMGGDLIISVYSEWQRSEAAANGVTCQECHMKPGDNGYAYHGFDSGSRNVNIYHGDLDIRDIVFNFPELSLTIENMVTAHALPAADTIKIFTLEISFQDSNGSEVYNIIETFGKRFTLMPLIGVVPHKQIENTQLQSDEVRTLNFTLPITVEDKINVVLIELKLYEVADEHQGDLTKAHRISDPIIVEQIELIP